MSFEIKEFKGGQPPGRGVYKSVSFEEYCSWPYLNHSILKCKSPAHMKAAMDGFQESTQAQKEGTLLHEMVIEPHLMKKYVAFPEEEILQDLKDSGYTRPRATKKYGEMVEEFKSKNEGKEIITQERMNQMEKVSSKVISHLLELDAAKRFNEVAIVWDEAGIRCKGRIDQLGISAFGDPVWAFDLKKHDDNIPFPNAIWKYRYHTQMSFYRSGLTANGADASLPVYLMCAETKEPYTVQMAPISDSCLELGDMLNRTAIDTVRDCVSTGHWPEEPSPVEWDVPDAAYKQVSRGYMFHRGKFWNG